MGASDGDHAMRPLLLLALAVLVVAACSDEPVPEDVVKSVPPDPEPEAHAPEAPSSKDAPQGKPTWLTQRPENAHAYADATLASFRKLVEGDGWREPAWNVQGTLEATHEKTGLAFVLVPGAIDMHFQGLYHEWSWDRSHRNRNIIYSIDPEMRPKAAEGSDSPPEFWDDDGFKENLEKAMAAIETEFSKHLK